MALPATDNFNRADGGLGSNWTEYGSTNRIVSNVVQGPSASADTFSKWNADTFSNDQYSKYKIYSTNGVIDAGPACRIGSSGVNGYFISTYGGLTTYAKIISGSYSGIANTTTTVTTNDIIELQTVGTGSGSLRGYKNGVALSTTATDSSLTSGGAGFFIYDSAAQIDDWEGGNVGGTSVSSILMPKHIYFSNLMSL
jgi:hypothetical protein